MTARITLACVTMAALAACATPMRSPVVTTPAHDLAEAERLADVGRSAEAASAYVRVADRGASSTASAMRLEAAELWWRAGEPAFARAQLARVNIELLDDRGVARARVLAATLAMHDGHPAEALARLPLDLSVLDDETAVRALGVRADAALALDNHDSAIADLVRRERLLDDPREIEENRRRIWSAIRGFDRADPAGDDPLLDGWLALAELRLRAWHDPWSFDAGLSRWRADFPDHPAAESFVPRLVEEQRALAGGVRALAVLLPLTGRFDSAAAAARDGLLAAQFRGPDATRRPRVLIYDTAGDPETAVARYREAVADGADFVIGPLHKEAVAAIARLRDLPVPVLALNTLDDLNGNARLFQFGLTPEDEAIQIAERISREGHQRGLALVPDNEFGLRMLKSFQRRFEELGGTILEAQLYDPQQRDHTTPIIRTLAIDESRTRHRILRTVLDTNLVAEPRRRRDAEFVFMVANPEQGRLLRPQLRFHHASDLPVYASSHVYTGTPDRSRDSDMDGVAFTDMPWTIAPGASIAEVRAELAAHLPGPLERNPRLFALGYDAYRLAPVLRHQPGLLREPVPAATGALWLDRSGRIHRQVTWAIFRSGVARELQAPAAPDTDFEDLPAGP